MFILTKVIGVCKDRFFKKVKINRKFLFSVMKISDVVKYKGNGIIILAVGETGTGKTSTAEVYSEQNHKFLYILQAD